MGTLEISGENLIFSNFRENFRFSKMSAEVAALPLGKAMSGYLEKANKSKVLMVGAGGIGCELLKNLVLSGFIDIVIIDLDTIDVSNLNRQFLFQKQHVGKSKSACAK